MANDALVIYRSEFVALLHSKSWFVRANLAEATFWLAMGIALSARALFLYVKRKSPWRAGITAATLVVFAASDVVEAHSGAWWRPWWLLVWKLACVALLLLFAAT